MISHNEISLLCRYWLKMKGYDQESTSAMDGFIYDFADKWNGGDQISLLRRYFYLKLKEYEFANLP